MRDCGHNQPLLQAIEMGLRHPANEAKLIDGLQKITRTRTTLYLRFNETPNNQRLKTVIKKQTPNNFKNDETSKLPTEPPETPSL